MLFTALLFLTAGGCLVMGVIYLMVGARHPRRPAHFWLGATAILGTVKALSEIAMYATETPSSYGQIMQWQLGITLTWGIAVTWFVVSYVKGLKSLGIGVTGVIFATLVVNALHAHGVVFEQVTDLRRPVMPWGDVISIGSGPINAWRFLIDVSGLSLVALMSFGTTRLMRTERRRQGLLLMLAGVTVIGAGLLHGLLVDLGSVDLPYLLTPAILIMIVILSADLGSQLVRKFELAEAVVSSEQRWNSLLEGVHLLIVIVGRDGRVELVNSHFTKVTGHASRDVVARNFLQLFPQEDRELRLHGFAEAMDEKLLPSVEAELLTKDGRRCAVAWSSVLLYDAHGSPDGVLAVGADITDRRRAEAGRDAAFREAEVFRKRLQEENVYLREEDRSQQVSTRLLGESTAIADIHRLIAEVATTDATVLIEGETGVGKELVARIVHETGPRAAGPFIRLNCAAISPGLAESELFGHERGAFTDANRVRKGRFELAHGGTLFLDEVAELPLDLQPKLLRALQEGEIQRVGSETVEQVDVRVIAATNRPLLAMVGAGTFREDLYYRLAVYPITVPPLRARKEDIALLVKHLVPKFAGRHGKVIREIPSTVLHELTIYDWPGNVRELMNVVERSVISCPDEVLRLTSNLSIPTRPRMVVPEGSERPTLDEVESGYIQEVLVATGGKINGPGGAAEILGVNPSTLRSRMKKLGISR